MDYNYTFEYRDDEGDEYSSDEYKSLADCRGEIRSLQLTGFVITRTFRYIGENYKGTFNY